MNALLTGYTHALLRNNQKVEVEAARRLAICSQCPLKKTTMGIDRCGNCGCPLAGLTRQNTKICRKWIR